MGEYELVDHTADIGVQVSADSLPDLFATAVAGLYAVVGDVKARDEVPQKTTIELSSDDHSTLLHDFLSELLFLLEVERQVLAGFEFERLDDHGLRVTADAARLDVERSDLLREVKAVTYHELDVSSDAGKWHAFFILDI